jgi:NhaA family Na+:H+ antiporter
MRIIKEFMKLESSAGILLSIAAVIALIVKNSPLEKFYDILLSAPLEIKFGSFAIHTTTILCINDFLMAIFFLLVGLEIKREVLEGRLSSKDQMSLPVLAALGGIAIPALIYTFFNINNPISMRGWAIPSATDIAFAIGVVTLLGTRVSDNLKICLLTIAIADDLVAALVIAIFYTNEVHFIWLLSSILPITLLMVLNKKSNRSLPPYFILGAFLWLCILNSGVHPTLAGVILAMLIPLKVDRTQKNSPLQIIEHNLHPWVAYLILPIFAFANAGVSLQGLSLRFLNNPITIGITAGLFIGKQTGVMLMSFIGIKLKLCKLPKHVTWLQYYGMSLVTGIGFTMSLFIGLLAFEDIEQQISVRLGVIIGSLLSGIAGYIVLRISCPVKENTPQHLPNL